MDIVATVVVCSLFLSHSSSGCCFFVLHSDFRLCKYIYMSFVAYILFRGAPHTITEEKKIVGKIKRAFVDASFRIVSTE